MSMKRYLLPGIAILTVAMLAGGPVSAQVPANFTGVRTTLCDSNSMAPGYIFVASCGRQGDKGPFFLQMMNNDGTPQAFQMAGNITPGDDYYPYDFKVLPNGLLF